MTDEYINKKDVVNLGVMMQTHLWTREQTYNAIFCLPSADVAPVRHGCLVDAGVSASGHRLAMCTICKRKMREGVEIGIVSRYCPNCGAKMDEGEDDE